MAIYIIDLLFLAKQFLQISKFGLLTSKTTYFIGFGIKKISIQLKSSFLNSLSYA